MPISAGLRAELHRLGLSPREDEPLARRGFWRIGGPADAWVEVPDEAALAGVMALGAPVTVVGAGSNLLVADAGIRGLAIKLVGALRDGTVSPAGAEVGGGMMNAVLLRRLDKAGLGGAAALAGVPGTLGGAVRMNAGWSLGEIGDRVTSVDVVLPGGERARLGRDDLAFAYRRTRLPAGAVVTRVLLSLLADPAAVREEAETIAAHLARRKATQPLDQPSCGSVFKNPPGTSAGREIDAAGLKGTQRGGARISDLHANFIVNTGGATADDVWWLVRHARQVVFERTGIQLEPEVHPVGDWPADRWPLPPLSG